MIARMCLVSALLAAGCGGFADVKTASGFCVSSSGWNGAPTTVIGCNREKGTTGGGISVECGQFKVTCSDIEKGTTPKGTP